MASGVAIGEGIPSQGCIEANAHALARYAALCQEAGLVPVVEPETLMDGEHTLTRCGEVTEEFLRAVFNQLHAQRVMLEGMILKPNMALPGLSCPRRETAEEVADATVRRLLRAVPAAVPGIAFLSGGQSCELASERLNAMNVRFKSRTALERCVSFARAIPTTGFRDLARRGDPREGGAASSVSSSHVQPGPRAVANTMPRWKKKGAHEDNHLTSRNAPQGIVWKSIIRRRERSMLGRVAGRHRRRFRPLRTG